MNLQRIIQQRRIGAEQRYLDLQAHGAAESVTNHLDDQNDTPITFASRPYKELKMEDYVSALGTKTMTLLGERGLDNFVAFDKDASMQRTNEFCAVTPDQKVPKGRDLARLVFQRIQPNI
jgi:hypothetical protein